MIFNIVLRAVTIRKILKINTEIFHKNYVKPYMYIEHEILEFLSRDLILF